jgi:TonB family protein
MTTLSDAVPQSMRGPWSFMGSVLLHGWILAWVTMGPSLALEKRKTPYEREIQPNEKKIVWYKLTDRLPNVTPPEVTRTARPPRARVKFEQNIAVGPKDLPSPPQLIMAPAPEIMPAKPLPLPNIVALAPPPRIVRPFLPPSVKAPTPEKAPTLPDAPKVSAAVPETKALAIEVKAPRIERRFTPPTVPKKILPADPVALPAAPDVDLGASLPKPAPALPPRKFVAPPKAPAVKTAPAAVDAPPPELTSASALPSDTALVIAGLNPAKSVEVPAPPGSVKAAFSGGPKPAAKGGDSASSDALLEIPSLTVQGGARNPQPPVMVAHLSPTSPEALAAAMRSVHPSAAPGGATGGQAARVSTAPDPRMTGRQVYAMAWQVPNLTSYSGSWLVWFADREADIGNAAVDMRPPLPLDMVSPRYVNSAVSERVEGKVRLWGVITKDGHVRDVSILQHLDDRLDRSAQEALSKWVFRPAVRNGIAIDVDAVFEVPFYLAPKTQR